MSSTADTVTINVPEWPMMTVHRSWTCNKKCSSTQKSTTISKQNSPTETPSHTSCSSTNNSSSPKSCEDEEQISRNKTRVANVKLRTNGQHIEFINATDLSSTKDTATRRLVRSHVMKGVSRERRVQRNAKLKQMHDKLVPPKDFEVTTKHLTQEEATTLSPPSRQSHALTRKDNVSLMHCIKARQNPSCYDLGPQFSYHFKDYPTPIPASMHHLITRFFTQLAPSIFPLDASLAYNPMKQIFLVGWSMTDTAVFHALLYSGAVCSTLSAGERDSKDVYFQMSRVIRLVNSRLNAGEGTSDSIVSAVGCLAMGEALRGNFDEWAVHMAGLKKMVEMRGGLHKMNRYLQIKLHRANLMGSVDQCTSPYFFPFDWSRRPAIYSSIYTPTSHTSPIDLILFSTLLSQHTAILIELRDFSAIIEQTLLTRGATLDPIEFIEACYSIQHQLLPQAVHVDDLYVDEDPTELGEAFRVAALIYMKLLTQESTFSATGSRILVSKLQNILNTIIASPHVETETSSLEWKLQFWLLVMGGMASLKQSVERTWFVAQLVSTAWAMKWAEVEVALEEILWVSKVLGAGGKALWEEVEVAKNLLDG